MPSIFGNKQRGSPRDILREVLDAIADAALVEQALHFFDDPASFADFADQAGSFPTWAEEERDPMPDELAEAVFQTVLLASDYAKMIDWADGPNTILDAYDALFSARNRAVLGSDIRQRVAENTKLVERGGAYSELMSMLHAEAKARGFQVAYLIAGQDAHFPVLVPEEAYRHWKSKTFGKGRPVFAY